MVTEGGDRLPRLELWWYDAEPADAGSWWGQAMGCHWRLVAVAERLGTTARMRDVDRALAAVLDDVENYLLRTYELRDRVLGLLTAITHDRAAVAHLKRPDRREAVLATLRLLSAEVASTARAVLRAMDQDIELRNVHTHRQLLSLGLYTGTTIYEARDLLLELGESERDAAVTASLRREMRRFALRYRDKARATAEAALAFLRAIEEAGHLTAAPQ